MWCYILPYRDGAESKLPLVAVSAGQPLRRCQDLGATQCLNEPSLIDR